MCGTSGGHGRTTVRLAGSPVNLGPAVNTVAQETTGSYWRVTETRWARSSSPAIGCIPARRHHLAGSDGTRHLHGELQPDGTLAPASRDPDLSTDFAGVLDFEASAPWCDSTAGR